ncbi:MAG: isoprenylcysteine carboxylmethyltransferase family protein [Rubrobacteraceae bacterium]|nr:isoprenylcysteine carboxylmethyltransferase family protein [Rubrobacteraceae bacterium]
MAPWALALYALYLALAFVGRTLLQLRTTGSTGFKGIGGRPGSAEWIGGVLFVVAILLGLAAPVLTLAGAMQPFAVLDGAVGHALGFALFFLGLAGTLWAQVAMGASWRIGVDEAETTDLVTAGPFAWVRNPIFSAMILTSFGLVLLVPNVAALIGFAALLVAIEVQVRLVEEPYLLRTHEARYADYTSRVGRFAPGVAGRLSADRVR